VSRPRRHDEQSEPRLVKGNAPRTLWPPGSKHGPCAKACNHTSCAAIKTDAAQTCDVCAQPIGYDEPFVALEGFLRYAHSDCLASAHITEAVA